MTAFELDNLSLENTLLFINDMTLNEEWLEHLNELAKAETKIVITESIKQQWPHINETHQLQFPITQMQLDALAHT